MGKKVILAVDDMPEVLSSINAVLKNDYDVRCAPDVESARTALQKIMPDLLLLDIKMPGVSGFDFFQELQKDDTFKKVPVVFLTANSEEETARKAIQGGAKGYIIKPFTPELLLESVSFFS
ncbi:MAG: response regulator [Spirochaetaceae bacterium]|jgi:putative two-component system response regulator|nr:response regulator [Spirochaetaceae bacterium]GMO31752.1 MAG: hypothetical protein Pg6A_20720 [Termitinemataceae bacterium]